MFEKVFRKKSIRNGMEVDLFMTIRSLVHHAVKKLDYSNYCYLYELQGFYK